MTDVDTIRGLLGRLDAPATDRNPLPFPEFATLPRERCAEALRFDRLLTVLPRPFAVGRLLQIGSGTGYLCLAFAGRGYACTGLEDDPARLAVAQAAQAWSGRNAAFIAGQASADAVRGLGRFDVALWLDADAGTLAGAEAAALLATLAGQAGVVFVAASAGGDPHGLHAALKSAVPAAEVDCLGPLPAPSPERLLFRLQPRRREDLWAMATGQMAEVRQRLSTTKPIYAKENAHFISRVYPLVSGDGQRVAVKTVQAKSEMARLLLFREHEFLYALDGPLFPRPVAFGFDGDAYILLLPWLEGPNLAQLFAAQQAGKLGRLKHPDVLRNAVASAAAQLRAAGIRHRDLRPNNVMLTPAGPMILDFGWACWADEAGCPAPPELAAPDDDAAVAALLRALS